MESTVQNHLTFGQIADDWASESNSELQLGKRERILGELFEAFWKGDFEDADQQIKLTINIQDDPTLIDRAWIFGVMPTGESHMPPKIRNASSDVMPYDTLAALKPHQYNPLFRQGYMEQITISITDFCYWVRKIKKATSPELCLPNRNGTLDHIGIKIQKVLIESEMKKHEHRKLGNSQIANLLAKKESDEKYENLGFEAIKQILQGNYPPAKRRGIVGLTAWMQERGAEIT